MQHETLNNRALTALITASNAINQQMDEQVVFRQIAEQARLVLECEGASLLVYDLSNDELIFEVVLGVAGDKLEGVRIDASKGIAGYALNNLESVRVNDVENDQDFCGDIDQKMRTQTRAILASPMIYQKRAVGVIEVLNPIGRDQFTEEDLSLLQVFANLAATATNHVKQFTKTVREKNGWKCAVKQPEVIGQSPAYLQTLTMCKKVAKTNTTVLILGKTGTGKEVAARMVHNHSERANKPFIPINCAALPEQLLESELFGHEKGAFTGAVQSRPGRFELAEGGSLFLDELGEMSLSIQVKLLRVLQEREYERVGGSKTMKCDVRIIAATNRDLKLDVAEKKFREDLYYRLNVFPIDLPTLNQRIEDIPLLVDHFVDELAVQMGVDKPTVSNEALQSLMQYSWPGNIRELRNVIERSVLLANDQITVDILPIDITGQRGDVINNGVTLEVDTQVSGQSKLAAYERVLIIDAMNKSNWNQSKAARQLGISRDNLRYRIKKYEIKRA